MSTAAPLAAPAATQEALLMVSVNGDQTNDVVPVVLGRAGEIYVRTVDLKAWRLTFGSIAKTTIGLDDYVELHSIPGLMATYDSAAQTLAITAPPSLFPSTRIDYSVRSLGPMTASAPGLNLNYDVSLTRAAGKTELRGFADLGGFLRNGSASNTMLFGSGKKPLTRLDSYLTLYNPARMSFLRIGDSVSRGSAATAPYRFAGLQSGRDFGTAPGYLTMPLPTFSGSASLPSTVDILANGSMIDRRRVSSGPFDLINLPVIDGSGAVQVTVRDVLGRSWSTKVDIYTSSELLRRGLTDYSYEVGFLRRGHGVASFDYGSFVASATYRRGLTNNLTAEVHGEVTRMRQVAEASATVLTPVGAVNIAGAGSNGQNGTGAMVQAGWQHRSQLFSSAAVVTYYSRQFGGAAPNPFQPRFSFNATAGLAFRGGSVGASYVYRTFWDKRPFSLAAIGVSLSLRKLGYINLSVFREAAEQHSNGVGVRWSVPLGSRINASVGYDRRGHDSVPELFIQRGLPTDTGFGFRARVDGGDRDFQEADLLYQNGSQTYELDIARTQGSLGVRANVRGALVLADSHLFAARYLNDSFAIVNAGQAGVRVYSDNHLVGRTNKAGLLIVPDLRAFDDNKIAIEQGDLPITAEAETYEKHVRPYRHAGVRIDYRVQLTQDALVRVTLSDGERVPEGATAHVAGRAADFVGTPGGEFYLTDLESENIVQIRWDGGECSLILKVPKNGYEANRAPPQICAIPTTLGQGDVKKEKAMKDSARS